MPTNLSTSIEIDATPEQVWAVVSDLRRMGEWSPMTRKVIVRGGELREGATTVNVNRLGWKVWPTRSKVTSYEPNKQVAFRIVDNGSQWIYDLEPLDTGTRTRLTETRDVSRGTTAVSNFLVDKALGGESAFETRLVRGMEATLRRIKDAVESSQVTDA